MARKRGDDGGRGGVALHLVSWAPSDYLNDEYVSLLLIERDYTALAFYHLFLNRSYLEGGSLPDLPPQGLVGYLRMPAEDVEHGLTRAIDAGKLVRDDGRLFHPRTLSEAENTVKLKLSRARTAARSANRRWNKEVTPMPNGCDGNANALPTHCDGNADAMRSQCSSFSFSLPLPLPVEEKLASRPPADADAAPPEEAGAVVLEFPCQGAKPSFPLYEKQVAEWQKVFPGLDVMQECRTAQAWCVAQPARRKTFSGMPKFLVNWLSRSADRGGGGRAAPQRYGGSGAAPSSWGGVHPDTAAALEKRRREREGVE